MKNIVLKIKEGDLFRFFFFLEKTEVFIGSGRSCDVVIKSQYVQSVQIRLLQKNSVWYAEDLSEADAKCAVLADGKRFRKPIEKFDGTLILRRTGEKEKAEIARISVEIAEGSRN